MNTHYRQPRSADKCRLAEETRVINISHNDTIQRETFSGRNINVNKNKHKKKLLENVRKRRKKLTIIKIENFPPRSQDFARTFTLVGRWRLDGWHDAKHYNWLYIAASRSSSSSTDSAGQCTLLAVNRVSKNFEYRDVFFPRTAMSLVEEVNTTLSSLDSA